MAFGAEAQHRYFGAQRRQVIWLIISMTRLVRTLLDQAVLRVFLDCGQERQRMIVGAAIVPQ
ncbi:hypothetical protein CBF45_05655 [Bordetella sp. J329]|nr:hypothetical protein CBF45_05655 [Bordetella sp. J329]